LALLDHFGEDDSRVAAEVNLTRTASGVSLARSEVSRCKLALTRRLLRDAAVVDRPHAQGSVQDQIVQTDERNPETHDDGQDDESSSSPRHAPTIRLALAAPHA
jgi:hypothetical protein